MLPEKIQNKELTSQQKIFIDSLFGAAKGNPKKAGELAGYAETSYPNIVKSLKDIIIERAEGVLAMHSPKAVMGLVDAMDEDGMTPAANIRIEAAKQILDRVGLVKKEKIDINAKIAHGIFILPPKDAQA
tara:strand:+ start:123 stop:512 length:390 start_codon:yes stop_codon:yes gene_type:complete